MQQHAPELLPAVQNGEMKLKDAAKQAAARKPPRPKPYDVEREIDKANNYLRGAIPALHPTSATASRAT